MYVFNLIWDSCNGTLVEGGMWNLEHGHNLLFIFDFVHDHVLIDTFKVCVPVFLTGLKNSIILKVATLIDSCWALGFHYILLQSNTCIDQCSTQQLY